MSTEIETYDDGAFTVFKTRFGTYNSKDKEGKGLCCGIDKEAVIYWSREQLRGYPTSTMLVTNTSITSDSLK